MQYTQLIEAVRHGALTYISKVEAPYDIHNFKANCYTYSNVVTIHLRYTSRLGQVRQVAIDAFFNRWGEPRISYYSNGRQYGNHVEMTRCPYGSFLRVSNREELSEGEDIPEPF